MHQTLNVVQKRELQYETVILWEQKTCSAPACLCSAREALLPRSSPAALSAAPHLLLHFSQTHLIFRSLSLFSLSRFLRISMNWLKKCSWSFLFWTSRNLWSRPYFSANSLNVVLENKTFSELLSLKVSLGFPFHSHPSLFLWPLESSSSILCSHYEPPFHWTLYMLFFLLDTWFSFYLFIATHLVPSN